MFITYYWPVGKVQIVEDNPVLKVDLFVQYQSV